MVDETEVPWLSAVELRSAVADGRLTVSDVAEAMIGRIEAINPLINAFVSFDPERIRADARRLDAKKEAGEQLGALFGVPYSVKLQTAVKGLGASAGLVPFKDEVASRDAEVVKRLRAADGLFLGQTNMPEAGYYGGANNHLFGRTENPWKLGYTAGGSSSGAAAAVAAGLGPLAEGGDGAGSVRIPASLCGVVGFKPSLGRIPQSMVEGRFYTFIFHGPIARTVGDAALMMEVMAGESEEDPLSLPGSVDYVAESTRSIAGLRIAYSEDAGTGAFVDPEVAAICRRALDAFTEAGASVSDDSPAWENSERAMWHSTWVPVYARENGILDWESLRGQVDDDLIELIAEGTRVSAVDIAAADSARGRIWDVFVEFMKDYDLLVTPTLASAAFPGDQATPEWLADKPLETRILGWLLTYPFNMLTTPAITVPAGVTEDGRPVGLQITGRLHADGDVLAAAARFEERRPWPLLNTPELGELPAVAKARDAS